MHISSIRFHLVPFSSHLHLTNGCPGRYHQQLVLSQRPVAVRLLLRELSFQEGSELRLVHHPVRVGVGRRKLLLRRLVGACRGKHVRNVHMRHTSVRGIRAGAAAAPAGWSLQEHAHPKHTPEKHVHERRKERRKGVIDGAAAGPSGRSLQALRPNGGCFRAVRSAAQGADESGSKPKKER